jgi:hypothetical protein
MAYLGVTASIWYGSNMRMLLRIVGVWLLLVAMVAAVVDATKSLAGGGAWVVTPMGQQWQALSPKTFDDARAAVGSHVSPFLWDPILTTILGAPTWVVFGILGVLLYWLGQKRKQVEVFIN